MAFLEVPIFSALAKRAATRRTERRQAAEQQLQKAVTTAKQQGLNRSSRGGHPTTPGYDHPADRWPY